MKKREDLAAGVYAASIAFVFLLSFIGAFVLPTGLMVIRWIGGLAMAGFFLGLPLLLRAAHRSRIQEAVAEQGGELGT